jgi:CheY-like chemotaxis protein
MVEDRERCLACGCNAFAAKPIDRRALLDLLAEHLTKS